MAKRVIDDDTLKAIADAMRAKSQYLQNSNFTPLQMPEMVGEVYIQGNMDGYDMGAESERSYLDYFVLNPARDKLSKRIADTTGEGTLDEWVNKAIEDFDNIQDAIHAQGVVVPDYDTSIMGELVNEVCQNKTAEGIEQGKQAQYDEFWDIFQEKGKRNNYWGAFKRGWTAETFKPKYDMTFVGDGAAQMFHNNYYSGGTTVDLREEALGVKLDFSQATTFNNTFGYNTWICAIGTIDGSSATNGSLYSFGLQGSEQVHTIEKVIMPDNNTQNMSWMYMYSLKNVVFEGVIGVSFTIPNSPLTKASITNIVEHLSTTATGKTLTLKKTAVNEAFGIDVDDETTYPEGSEFYTLRHSKDNWTFSYA